MGRCSEPSHGEMLRAIPFFLGTVRGLGPSQGGKTAPGLLLLSFPLLPAVLKPSPRFSASSPLTPECYSIMLLHHMGRNSHEEPLTPGQRSWLGAARAWAAVGHLSHGLGSGGAECSQRPGSVIPVDSFHLRTFCGSGFLLPCHAGAAKTHR